MKYLDKLILEIQSSATLLKKTTSQQPLKYAKSKVLATNIHAPIDLPRQDVSAMDGYALAKNSSLTDRKEFKVVGESVAGETFLGNIQSGTAVRIMTGAVIPHDCDTVVMQENVTTSEDHITLKKSEEKGSNIRFRGEEIKKGELLIDAGTILTPAHITLLSSIGVAEVTVNDPLTIGIIASGNELKSTGEPLENLSQIYNANSPTIYALLEDMPIIFKDYGIIPDNLDLTILTLKQASAECDVVISSAGVSVGDYDYVTTAITKLGTIKQHKVAMKPGKPIVYGEINSREFNDGTYKSTPYFGLPGNPLSTFISCLLIVKPVLWKMLGVKKPPELKSFTASLTGSLKKRIGRRDFQRGIMTKSETGHWKVSHVGKQDSHRVKGLSMANCLIDLSEEDENKIDGEIVKVIPFPWH